MGNSMGDLNSMIKNFVQSGVVLVAALSFSNAFADFSGFQPGTIIQTDIIGGSIVQSGDPIASSTVMLFGKTTDNGQEGEYICSASIIAPDTLVTAAHCVAEDPKNPTDPTQLVVVFAQSLPNGAVFGSVDPQEIFNDPASHAIYGYEANPNWLGANDPSIDQPDAHDIAVIRFKGGLPTGFAPATVLDASIPLNPGDPAILAGYGITSSKTQQGAGTLRKVEVTVEGPSGTTEEMIQGTARKDMCSGDSGGPAFATVNGQLQVWGVTSRGDAKCSQGGIYTKITAYTDFINKAMSDLSAAPTN